MIKCGNILHQFLIFLIFTGHFALVGYGVNARLGIWPRHLDFKHNAYLRCFFAFCSGLLVDIAGLFLLGILGYFCRIAVMAGGGMLAVAAVVELHRQCPLADRLRSVRLSWTGLWEVTAILGLFLFVMSQAIRVPGWWDDTMYHLPLARFYVEKQAICLNDSVRFPLVPQNIHLLFSLGLMMGREILAQGLAIFPLFVIGLGLIGAAVWLMGSVLPGYFSLFLLINLLPVHETLGYAYIDNGLALFCWGSLLAVAIWLESGDRLEWIFLAGMLAGGAAGSKYFGVVLALALGFYLLVIRRAWRASGIYTLSAILWGGWWYLRNVVISGDPVHPMGGNLLGHYLWNAGDLEGMAIADKIYIVGKGLSDIWPVMLKSGVALLAPAFLFLLFFRREKPIFRLFQFVFVLYFTGWFYTSQINRYLAPVMALGSFLSIYYLYQFGLVTYISLWISRLPWLGGLLCLAGMAPLCREAFREAADRREHWNQILESRHGYALLQRANQLIPTLGPKMIQIGFEGSLYFYKGSAFGDWFGPGRYRGMFEGEQAGLLQGPNKMAALMKMRQTRLLLLNTDLVRLNLDAYQQEFRVVEKQSGGMLLELKTGGN